ncbi:hypothetical protein TVAG_101990 [Trichomonas vaginalis G3]|uniref:Uncharacterized protein n=1 Tax=Trichomonas vaginalis (strain ATCC PRA-98 / G3) TaxID=412133 RepID=A2FEF7_TRIV3|nr:guanylate cyclase protein [Trichomonas vaginalis G3]EAX96694.1 hypothetical protein TVAG_101990 [Trichomonas vaginalis G3]KAI5509227.1 guanylate cyclase protein [Trichomonas vaginalis G3]|eukprot:XP_001309624.1 hypothetical protein [Trichomonas vaginalis G3]
MSFDSLSIDFEHQEMICKKYLRDSKVRLALHHGVMGMKPIQAKLIVGAATLIIISVFPVFIGFYVYFMQHVEWRKGSYYDIRSQVYSLFFTHYANFYILMGWAKTVNRYDDSTAILGNITIDEKTTKPVVND